MTHPGGRPEGQNGFTIKCNKCGNEIEINTTRDFNKEIYFYNCGYDGELGIHCTYCENVIEEIEDPEHTKG